VEHGLFLWITVSIYDDCVQCTPAALQDVPFSHAHSQDAAILSDTKFMCPVCSRRRWQRSSRRSHCNDINASITYFKAPCLQGGVVVAVIFFLI